MNDGERFFHDLAPLDRMSRRVDVSENIDHTTDAAGKRTCLDVRAMRVSRGAKAVSAASNLAMLPGHPTIGLKS